MEVSRQEKTRPAQMLVEKYGVLADHFKPALGKVKTGHIHDGQHDMPKGHLLRGLVWLGVLWPGLAGSAGSALSKLVVYRHLGERRVGIREGHVGYGEVWDGRLVRASLPTVNGDLVVM